MIEPRDYALMLLKWLGITLVVLAFYLVTLNFPFHSIVSAVSLLLGLAALSAE